MELYYIRHEKLIPLLTALRSGAETAYIPHYINHCLSTTRESAALAFLSSAVLLKEILGVTEDDHLRFAKAGKPYLVNGDSYFSISHDEDYTIMTVSPREHGCDIEKISQRPAKIAKRTYPQAYLTELAAAPTAETGTRLWTQLEAILKAEGTGFTCSLQDHPELLDKWTVESFLFDGYMISIAASEGFEFPAMKELTI